MQRGNLVERGRRPVGTALAPHRITVIASRTGFSFSTTLSSWV
ncbi:hypothetical protein [Streptomyces vietnamensis]